MVKYAPDHFGAYGFVRHHDGEGTTLSINVEDIERQLGTFLEKGFATKAGETVEVDLGKAGFQKLLGRGRATRPMKILVASFTERAKAKVEAARGTVESPKAG